MAGDLNIGSYVLGGESSMSESVPAVVQSLETAPIAATTHDAPAISDPGELDAALAGNETWLSPEFLPSCPAVTLEDTAMEMMVDADGAAETNARSVTTPQVLRSLSGLNSSRERGAGARSASDSRDSQSLGSTGMQTEIFVGIGEPSSAAGSETIGAHASRRLGSETNRRSNESPSLANQSLANHAQSDVFMAMALLPSSPSIDRPDSQSLARPSDPRSRHAAFSDRRGDVDGLNDDVDLSSLRQSTLGLELTEFDVPRSFLTAAPASLSAVMDSIVSIDCFSSQGESEGTDETSLVKKISENRYRFAAFAFVFTIVTTRLNRNDSERQDPAAQEDDLTDSRLS
ncbi:hypothetical protein CA85_17170 [Allorhodopirellula solitaria]|uniref:Uncharacterized protein n=2 Tax=Allorhodopirellula solitaria TaxID=2527987 RepID=A0A5C5YE82_9BACT|nr:hypothetical protein CA85_17170 [Allorhodopirellula solitaria]